MSSRRSVARPRRQRSDNEGEVTEENNSGSSSSSIDSEKVAQRRRQEIAEGKRPLVLHEGKGPLNLKLDKKAAMLALAKAGFQVVTGKSQTEAAVKLKASETKATVEPKAKRGRMRRSFAVTSNYNLRSKGMVVDVASETNADRKRKRKEEETDDYQGPVADTQEVCKKIKKEANNDDDDGTDDDDGNVGGAHTNVPNVGLEIAAGN